MKKKGNFYRAVIKLLGILFLLFVGSRQHAPAFSNLPASLLAPTSPQSLCPSSSHATTPRLFPTCRRPCWRRPLRKAFVLRRATPTRPGFSRPAGAHVGALFPQGLITSSGHANTPWVFPICRRICWRRPSRKAFALRRATPRPKSIEPEICAIQNERKTALPIPSRSFLQKFVRAEITQR